MADRARAAGLRVDVDDAKQSVGKKIRAAQLMKVPYAMVIGDRDLEAGTFTLRGRGGVETPDLAFERIVEGLVAEASFRSLVPTDFAAG
jgi:threonyl-tRNA synthetase